MKKSFFRKVFVKLIVANVFVVTGTVTKQSLADLSRIDLETRIDAQAKVVNEAVREWQLAVDSREIDSSERILELDSLLRVSQPLMDLVENSNIAADLRLKAVIRLAITCRKSQLASYCENLEERLSAMPKIEPHGNNYQRVFQGISGGFVSKVSISSETMQASLVR